MDRQDNLNKPIEYCLYARKSSESDERQAMSVDSQIKEMQQLAIRDGIFVKEIRYESHSAKESGQRPVFKELIADIKLGTFNGILTWHPDRLSRNAGDLGSLVDLMDNGKLHQIKTYSQSFQNTPNDKFLLMILCSQAKLENDNKSVNVKRGIRTKCEMGWRPSTAPLGYINRAFGGVKDIIIDVERAPFVKQAFEKAAYMYASGRTIKTWLDEQGFVTRNNKKIALSAVYAMLKNPFYYGHFEFPIGSGKWYKGSHQPLISKELYDDTQKEIVDPNKRSYIGNIFQFKGLFVCHSCGSSVCGEEKNRKLKDGRSHHHIYYHCTRYKDLYCKEPYIKQRHLINELLRVIGELKDEELVINEKLEKSMKEYEKIIREAKYLSKYGYDGEITIRDYAEYIIREGSMSARRDLIAILPIPKKLHNKQLVY